APNAGRRPRPVPPCHQQGNGRAPQLNGPAQVQRRAERPQRPDTSKVAPLALDLGAEARVYREKGGWQGPYKVLSVGTGKDAVELPNGPAEFAATHIKPYNRFAAEPDSAPATAPAPAGDDELPF